MKASNIYLSPLDYNSSVWHEFLIIQISHFFCNKQCISSVITVLQNLSVSLAALFIFILATYGTLEFYLSPTANSLVETSERHQMSEYG